MELPTCDNPVSVIEGDALEMVPTIPPGVIDAVVTDPPYLLDDSAVEYGVGDGVAARAETTSAVGMPWGYSLDWVGACARLEPRQWVVFASFHMLAGVIQAVERHAKLSAVFTWRKSNAPNMARPVPRMDCEFIVWARAPGAGCGRMNEFRSLVIDVPGLQAGCMADERYTRPGSGKALHPCQKPLAVVRPFVARIDATTILDPFAGTGTTGAAAIREGKRAVLVERDSVFASLARRRIAEAMGTGLLAGIA
jgi:DNA modification methylase